MGLEATNKPARLGIPPIQLDRRSDVLEWSARSSALGRYFNAAFVRSAESRTLAAMWVTESGLPDPRHRD